MSLDGSQNKVHLMQSDDMPGVIPGTTLNIYFIGYDGQNI